MYEGAGIQKQSFSTGPFRESEGLRKKYEQIFLDYSAHEHGSLWYFTGKVKYERVSIWRGLDVAASEIPIEAIHFPRAEHAMLSHTCM